MTQSQLADAVGVIATADRQAAEKTKGLFKNSHVSRTAADLEKEVRARSSVDFLIVDLELPKLEPASLVKMIRSTDALTIVMTTNPSQGLLDALGAGADFVLKPFRKEDLLARVRILDQRRKGQHQRSMDPALPHLVEKLHDPKDGRLDAVKVAGFFAIPVSELARAIGRGVSTVHKTPTASNLQKPLRRFEPLVSGLLRLTGSERRARMWLSASNPALDGHAPIELLRMGKVGDLAGFVQDLLEGRPA